MAGSTSKRVVLYRYEREPLYGIVSPGAYLLDQGVELLSVDGNLVLLPYSTVKAICFVSEFADPQLFTHHNLFERRPRVGGLWTRFTFHDSDQLDGILPHNLLEWPSQGYTITPPLAGGSRQRVFIPREAVKATELRGVVGVSVAAQTPGHRRSRRTVPDEQLNIFLN